LVLAVVLAVSGALARKIIRRARLLPQALIATVASGPRATQALEPAELLYDGKLLPGWDDWGWGPHQLGNGPAKIVFAGYGGWLLHHTAVAWRYGGVAFRFHAPEAWGEFLQVALRHAGKPDGTFPVVPITARHIARVDGWQEVLVDWKELNPDKQPFDSVLIGSRSQVGPESAELDRVMLTKPPAKDSKQGTLSVLCDGASHPISELIYGASGDDWGSGQSAQRIGGNPLSRDNWELGAWNTGSDWFFENVGQPGNLFQALDAASQAKRKIAMVVPMLGWVAKDQSSVGFPRAKFGAQRKHDPYKGEAGDGYSADGKPIVPGDPSQTSVPAPPELIAAWVRKVLAQDAQHGSRSIHMYILDNEPTLWNTTHRDVHPNPLSYDELLERTIQYASAIRDADPEAVIAGPAEWGFTGYEYSAVDREAGTSRRPDRRAHGDVPLVAWYLKKLAEHEKATGKRLLDVFDLHFYPAAQGLYGGNAGTDPTTADLRMRSTRALWDPEYVDESWIKEELRLIPRMRDWVRENYPGRKLSIGEWNFGAEEHVSGGLATVEALGRFGEQGLDAAFYWGNLKEGTPTYWAFRAFRDFDGHGARFQDISLATRASEPVSLFASRDGGMTRLVLVLVNRDQTVQVTSRIALQGCGPVGSARMFTYAAESKGLTERPLQVTEGAAVVTLEPFSFAVIEMGLAKATP
jgi:Glycoside hydrolase family 44